MKWALVVLLPLLLAGAWELSHRSEHTPDLGVAPRFEPARLELGELDPAARARFEAKLVNPGRASIGLGHVSSDCGVLGLALDPTVLPPGGSAKLTGYVEAGPSAGTHALSVHAPSADGSSVATLELSLTVREGLFLQPGVLHAGWVVGDQEPSWSWWHLYVPGVPADAGRGRPVDLEIEVTGDFDGESRIREGQGQLWELGVRPRLRPGTAFGFLEARVRVSSRTGRMAPATVRLLLERAPVASGWPLARLHLADPLAAVSADFPGLEIGEVIRLDGLPPGLVLTQERVAGGARITVAPEGLHVRPALPITVAVHGETGTLNLRLTAAVQ